MINRFMVSVAALALISGTGLASAQGMNKESGGASGGAATQQHSTQGMQQGAQQHSTQGEATGGAKGSAETKGGMKSSQSEQKQPGAAKNERAEDNVKGGSTSQRAEDRDHAKGGSANQRAEEGTKSGTKAEGPQGTHNNMKAEGREGTRNNMKAEGRENERSQTTTGQGGRQGRTEEMNRSNEGRTEMNRTNERSSTTTGQAGAGAKLTSDQRTKITSVFRSERVEPENNVNFSIAVGSHVPRQGVRLHALPSEVVTIYPEWRGYEFIRVHDQILVVDPNTYEIVAVLEA